MRITYIVTVSGSKFVIDSASAPILTFRPGDTYRFDQSDSTNTSNPLRLSATSDGTHGGGSEYTTGVTTAGTPGSSGAYTEIATTSSTSATLYYYNTATASHGTIFRSTGYNQNAGFLKPIVGGASEAWGPMIHHNVDRSAFASESSSAPHIVLGKLYPAVGVSYLMGPHLIAGITGMCRPMGSNIITLI